MKLILWIASFVLVIVTIYLNNLFILKPCAFDSSGFWITVGITTILNIVIIVIGQEVQGERIYLFPIGINLIFVYILSSVISSSTIIYYDEMINRDITGEYLEEIEKEGVSIINKIYEYIKDYKRYSNRLRYKKFKSLIDKNLVKLKGKK